MDLALPESIERRAPGTEERTILLDAQPLGQAPWQPTPTQGHEVWDLADLGDHEGDPFATARSSQIYNDLDFGDPAQFARIVRRRTGADRKRPSPQAPLVNLPRREPKIFAECEGKVEHVGADIMSYARDYIADTLGGHAA